MHVCTKYIHVHVSHLQIHQLHTKHIMMYKNEDIVDGAMLVQGDKYSTDTVSEKER